MFGIQLHGQNLTGNFRGFALKAANYVVVNDKYRLDVYVRHDDILVLGETEHIRVPYATGNQYTPDGIALRSNRPGELIDIACNRRSHAAQLAVFSPSFRAKEQYGIEIYNDFGNIAYSSADYYLTPVAIVDLPFGFDAERSRLGSSMSGFDGPKPIYFEIPIGKKYGVILGSWGSGSTNRGEEYASHEGSPYYGQDFYYFGYYCEIKQPQSNRIGWIAFRMGSSGLPPDAFGNKGRFPTAKAIIVDITGIDFPLRRASDFQKEINR